MGSFVVSKAHRLMHPSTLPVQSVRPTNVIAVTGQWCACQKNHKNGDTLATTVSTTVTSARNTVPHNANHLQTDPHASPPKTLTTPLIIDPQHPHHNPHHRCHTPRHTTNCPQYCPKTVQCFTYPSAEPVNTRDSSSAATQVMMDECGPPVPSADEEPLPERRKHRAQRGKAAAVK